MKVVGIIAEYNPFHNGHQYHIQEAKKQTAADYVVVVMSGNFVQRGAPAIIHKYTRTKAAIESGADLVFELPVIYSTASAENFALGAISLLDKLGIVDYLVFGSESGDIHSLTSIAKYLILNSGEYNKEINKYIKSGITFPMARQKAIKANCPGIDDSIISSPNNILGIEYIKAILTLNSKIEPVTISRKQAEYHEPALSKSVEKDFQNISSATSIRKAIIKHETIDIIESHMPVQGFKLLKHEYNKTFPINKNDFSILLKYKLLQESSESLTSYIDVSKDLANRLKNTDFIHHNYDSYSKEIKSKQWTLTRINRVLIHILLNLTTQSLNLYKENNYCQYARVLGCHVNSTSLLKIIKQKTAIPIITNVSKSSNTLSNIPLKMLKEDIFAADLYNLVVEEKYQTTINNEYLQGIIII